MTDSGKAREGLERLVAACLKPVRYVADPGDPHYSYRPDLAGAQRIVDAVLSNRSLALGAMGMEQGDVYGESCGCCSVVNTVFDPSPDGRYWAEREKA